MAHRDLPVRSLAPKSPDFLAKLRDLFFHVQPHPDACPDKVTHARVTSQTDRLHGTVQLSLIHI